MDSRELARRGRAFEHLFDAVIVTDRAGSVCDLNSAAERLFGVTRDDSIGIALSEILEDDTGSGQLDGVDGRFHREGRWHAQSRTRQEDGHGAQVEVRMVPLFDEAGGHDGAICICRDITLRVRQEAELARLAHTDQLTGLPNRALFGDRLRNMLAHSRRTGQRLGLLFIDLDGFKAVNDKAGHAAGDEILRVVAQRLGRVLRENDTLARWGGDEFTVVLDDIQTRKNAEFVATKLLETMVWPVAVAGQRFRLGISIGIALSPDHGQTLESLLQAADRAMYQAKAGGRQRFEVARREAEESVA